MNKIDFAALALLALVGCKSNQYISGQNEELCWGTAGFNARQGCCPFSCFANPRWFDNFCFGQLPINSVDPVMNDADANFFWGRVLQERAVRAHQFGDKPVLSEN